MPSFTGVLVVLTDSSDLVRLAQKGNVKAFEQLIVNYQNRVFSYCYQLTGNHDNAQDLAQDVFIQAYKSLKSFRREADFGTWLRRITLNKWINAQRKNKIITVSLNEPVATVKGEYTREIAAGDESPEDIIEQAEYLELVWQALDRLSSEFRQVLILRDMEEYSYEEIANILGCSLGTVKSRLNRGRKYIRQEIEFLQRNFIKNQNNSE
ncbi:MAG: sigma-70 family RNA polymerase sigma factor [Syntrophomonas sp.]